MQTTSSSLTPAETFEAFMAALNKDAQSTCHPEAYVSAYLAATLRDICKYDEYVLARIKSSTHFMETEQSKVVS